jgi:cytochrome c1
MQRSTLNTQRSMLKARQLFVIGASAALLLIIGVVGCHSGGSMQSTPSSPTAAAGPTTKPMMASLFGPAPQKGGAQLWAENCTRCHNAPSPDRYSDAQWEVVVDHMRLRANLTGQEARQIAEFLKASN